MKVKDIERVQDIVEDVLTDCRAARNSDNILYFKVYQRLLDKKGMDITKVSAGIFFLNLKQYGLPSTETIRRTRQKLQATNEFLRGDKDVSKAREENEEVFKQYARE